MIVVLSANDCLIFIRRLSKEIQNGMIRVLVAIFSLFVTNIFYVATVFFFQLFQCFCIFWSLTEAS